VGGFTRRLNTAIFELGHRSAPSIGVKSAPGASNTRRRRNHHSGTRPMSKRLLTGGRCG
jgi:hypothetical protein